MTALAKARQRDRITDAIHAVLDAHPQRAGDARWIINEVAIEYCHAPEDVKAVYEAKFKDNGAA